MRTQHLTSAADNWEMKRQDARDAREPDQRIDDCARRVIDCALEVHRTLGPGFLESVYEHALCVEMGLRGLPFERQARVLVNYKGRLVGEGQVDLLIAGRLVVELKAVEALAPIHGVQVRSYLKATNCLLGLLINFNVPVLLRGVRRIILSS
jgi:GxxExxY protein